MLRLCGRGIRTGSRLHVHGVAVVQWGPRYGLPPIPARVAYGSQWRGLSSPSGKEDDSDNAPNKQQQPAVSKTRAKAEALMAATAKGVVSASRSTLDFFLHPLLIPKKLNIIWGHIKDAAHHYWV